METKSEKHGLSWLNLIKKCRIYIVKFWTRPTPSSNSFNFMQFSKKNWQNHMLAPPQGGPRGNPASATRNGTILINFLTKNSIFNEID